MRANFYLSLNRTSGPQLQAVPESTLGLASYQISLITPTIFPPQAKRDDLIGTIPRTYARPPVKKAQEATPLKAAPKEVLKKLTPTKAAMDKSMNFDQEGQSRGYCNWEVKAEKKEEKGAMKKSEFSKRKQSKIHGCGYRTHLRL